MTGLIAALWWIGLIAAACSIAYQSLALAAVMLWRPRFGPGWASPPQVTVLKPMYGVEDGLEEAVASCFAQAANFPVRYVLGFHRESDPALALARRVAARFPGLDVTFVIDETVHGLSPKMTNLINMAKGGGLSEVVVLSDSDTFMEPGELQEAVDALSASGVGTVTALYRARPGIAGNPMRMFGAWFIDYWFLPMAALHARLGPLAVTYAPLTAIRQEVLEAIGGLEALADEFADDNALGRLVRQAGWEVAFTPRSTATLANDPTMRELYIHELRWSRTVRGIDFPGFVASVVTHPGPLPLLLLVSPGVPALALIGGGILLRWLLARAVVGRFGRSAGLRTPGPLGLWLRDNFNFAVWVGAFTVRHVDWRGQKIALDGSNTPYRRAA